MLGLMDDEHDKPDPEAEADAESGSELLDLSELSGVSPGTSMPSAHVSGDIRHPWQSRVMASHTLPPVQLSGDMRHPWLQAGDAQALSAGRPVLGQRGPTFAAMAVSDAARGAAHRTTGKLDVVHVSRIGGGTVLSTDGAERGRRWKMEE